MSTKTLLLLSNGYGEDSFASLLLEKLVQFSRVYKIPSTFLVIPLIGKGAQFNQIQLQYPDQVSIITPPFSLPNGGVYLGLYVKNRSGLLKTSSEEFYQLAGLLSES
jgi:hypothetical protein